MRSTEGPIQRLQISIASLTRSAMFAVGVALLPDAANAGAQAEEALAASVQAALHRSVSDLRAPRLMFPTEKEGEAWLAEMSRRLEKKMPDPDTRRDFLISVQYEAKRAGLDPQMVLGLIQLESDFRKYAVSSVGARGFMQVMPFWTKLIGNPDHDLFSLRTNLRYGCIILRHYLDRENGDLFRALGRYNGSLGKPEYPDAVMANLEAELDLVPSMIRPRHPTVIGRHETRALHRIVHSHE